MAKLYRNRKTQATLEFISFHGQDFAMMRDNTGKVEYYSLSDLVEYEVGKGVTGVKPVSPAAKKDEEKEERRPTALPVENRLNINTATAEQIADFVHGIGYTTAKKIVEKRATMPNERFSELGEIQKVTNRVPWDEIFAEDKIYVG